MNRQYKIILIGPQGSGKGTQAARLSRKLDIPVFGTGDLIRKEIASGSEHGVKMKGVISKGNLISDNDAVFLLKKNIELTKSSNGYIIDGYPRNISQFNIFDFDSPTHVIVLEMSSEESVRRLSQRLICNRCQSTAKMSDGIKPGDRCECGGEWYQREDDKPEAIKRRLEIYNKETMPVIQKYKEQGILHIINAIGTENKIFERIMMAIK